MSEAGGGDYGRVDARHLPWLGQTVWLMIDHEWHAMSGADEIRKLASPYSDIAEHIETAPDDLAVRVLKSLDPESAANAWEAGLGIIAEEGRPRDEVDFQVAHFVARMGLRNDGRGSFKDIEDELVRLRDLVRTWTALFKLMRSLTASLAPVVGNLAENSALASDEAAVKMQKAIREALAAEAAQIPTHNLGVWTELGNRIARQFSGKKIEDLNIEDRETVETLFKLGFLERIRGGRVRAK